jgi:hypothetical protein
MDYGALVKKALDIMWKFKYLWVFGFFVQALSGGGGGIGRLSDKWDKFKFPVGRWADSWNGLNGLKVTIDNHIGELAIAVILLLILAALVIFLIFLVLGIISQGGLIHCVSRIQSGEKPTLGDGWSVGVKNFWRMLGIWIIIVILVLASVFLILVPFILVIIASGVLGLLFGMFLIPLFILAIIFISLIDFYSTRTCILEGKGVFDSLAGGWETLKNNLSKTIMVTIISIGSTIVYIIGLIVVGLILAIPFVLIAIANPLLGIVLGVLAGLIYIIVVTGAWGAYIDSLWTLAFMELKKLKPAETA